MYQLYIYVCIDKDSAFCLMNKFSFKSMFIRAFTEKENHALHKHYDVYMG